MSASREYAKRILPERIRLAAEYCADRGALVGIDARPDRCEIPLHEPVPAGARVVSIALLDYAITIEYPCTTIVRITGASDADAVALRLAGFAPDGETWVWRS